jgi:hypothetical protein
MRAVDTNVLARLLCNRRRDVTQPLGTFDRDLGKLEGTQKL